MDTNIWPEIDGSLCTACGDCVPACPGGALAVVAGQARLARPELCQFDGRCESVCLAGAIQLPYAITFAGAPAKPAAPCR